MNWCTHITIVDIFCSFRFVLSQRYAFIIITVTSFQSISSTSILFICNRTVFGQFLWNFFFVWDFWEEGLHCFVLTCCVDYSKIVLFSLKKLSNAFPYSIHMTSVRFTFDTYFFLYDFILCYPIHVMDAVYEARGTKSIRPWIFIFDCFLRSSYTLNCNLKSIRM